MCTTLYIANGAFGCLRKFGAIYQHHQIVRLPAREIFKNLALKINKLKTKYNALAQCKLESLSLSTALHAIHQTVGNNLKTQSDEK
jgi:hypothetical protein